MRWYARKLLVELCLRDTLKLRGLPKAACYQAGRRKAPVAELTALDMVKTHRMPQWVTRSQAPKRSAVRGRFRDLTGVGSTFWACGPGGVGPEIKSVWAAKALQIQREPAA